ncbi:MAG: hypothetical protein P1V18_04630 [Candidatus Gracilibacteria bacterium]|nr:hypothetical protein [Candidatus Gracilibacteria bacterium]
MNNFHIKREIGASIILAVLLITISNPFDSVYISEYLNYWIPIAVMVFFGLAFFMCHKPSNDERQQLLLLLGERFGFMAGSLILMIGLIIQVIDGLVDPWLLGTFVVMLLAKTLGMIYGKVKH